VAPMHLVSQKHLKEAAERYPDAAKQIAAWRSVAKDGRWRSFDDVHQVFADVDRVRDHIVFRIHNHRYRLVTVIQYPREAADKTAQGHIWIRSFLSEKQYADSANWNKGVLR
jgi:mRNA interferase HigB